ncbi:MAG: hypothetical protein JJV92_04690 [Desulfosarcina sp.]|nr:hypothetical protein [Desulfobacterales bacterium]
MSIITPGKSETWKPLSPDKISAIKKIFADLFPADQYADQAARISDYWTQKIRLAWNNKAQSIKDKYRQYRPFDPLSRTQQKTVLISYADSVSKGDENSLITLDCFLSKYFPAIRGLHLLPACQIVENRFNDGFFSQVVRNKIHEPFGTNQQYAEMMEKYFSMSDFVLNHVDIANPLFQAFLDGDDDAGQSFYIFTEEKYQKRLKNGDFDQIFRPRPFPLFTIFRRKPKDDKFAKLNHKEKIAEINNYFGRFDHLTKGSLPEMVVGLLSIFNKIQNDQMLLPEDYRNIIDFRAYLEKEAFVDPDTIFTLSATQETRHKPYIFNNKIKNMVDLLESVGYRPDSAMKYAEIYQQYDPLVFGEEIRALTTFSHVQVDLNTLTYQGLKMLADDFLWYLGMDLNMLRLDAANFAFKKWKTSCFGLSEVKSIMKILYLSMDCVAPGIVPNLEVNDQLGNILNQMADNDAPPPMMYDFHLASMLPVVFNTGNSEILSRIFKLIAKYDIPKTSIRFSLAESHDGKSVRGSLDLLLLAERQNLADTVEINGGKIKYKAVPRRQYAGMEFQELCRETGIDCNSAKTALFKDDNPSDTILYLRKSIHDESDIARALGIGADQLAKNDSLKYFVNKVINGREPYELCISTIDSMIKLDDKDLEAKRYLAFYTLAFALMGRNVKSIYFNDLLGLPNDYKRLKENGELRDIKRTKSDFKELEKRLSDPVSLQHKIAKGINNIIALADMDPALHFRGNEAEAGISPAKSVALIHNSCSEHHTLVIVNVKQNRETITIDLGAYGLNKSRSLFDNIEGKIVQIAPDGKLYLPVQPYQGMWLTRKKVEIPSELLFP